MKCTVLKQLLQIVVIFSLLFCFIIIGSACNSQQRKVEKAEAFLVKWGEAWQKEDGVALLSMFTEDIIGFDAQAPGWSYDKTFIDLVANSTAYWDSISTPQMGTSFVSPDGRFCAAVNESTIDNGKKVVPIASVYVLKDEKVDFAFDYYGGSLSETGPQFSFVPRTLDPGSDEAKKLVEMASAIVAKWRTSYNSRDTEAYLACFAGDAICVDVVEPEWRVLSKTELNADVTSRFARPSFESRIAASAQSPIPEGCFVSADGRYAAAQGNYKDKGTKDYPMLIFLEIQNGLIVKQYNYLLLERDDLIPS